LVSHPPLAPGTEIAGRYLVEALLGRGGMGAVFRVMDRVLGEPVALKLMDGVQGDPVAVERFRREVRLARRITHRNVARTFDIGEHGGVPFLTMELVSGQSLSARIREAGRLDAREALGVARSICSGLTAAHEAGIIHRDLKPANVLLDASGRVVILDFGIARAMGEATLHSQGVPGTPAYMAPEQLTGDSLDGRTDLYALGVILHQMLTGRLPRWGEPGALLARLERELPEVFLTEHTPEVQGAVLRLLARDPARRPATAREVERLLGGTPDAASTVPARLASNAPRAERTEISSLPEAARSLAVVPFRDREDEGLGVEIAEGLVDALSRAHGLRVLSSSATARFGTSADPQEVGRELGVDLVVEGSVRRLGDGLRVTARCVDAGTGVQVWNERFEIARVELLALEDELGQRIAEALRVELTIAKDRGLIAADALQLYMAGRSALRASQLDSAQTFTRALQLAPGFRPAIAAHALASVRDSLTAERSEEGTQERLEATVARALREAPDLPDSHLAAGIFATNCAKYAEAAQHLRRAVALAPTFAVAQEYLGRFQCEAGRAEEGIRRLELVLRLDPLLAIGAANLVRHYFFRGREDDRRRVFDELVRRTGGTGPVIWQLELRHAAWQRDVPALGAVLERLTHASGTGPLILRAYGELVLSGDPAGLPLERMLDVADTWQNLRFRSFANQLIAEALASCGSTGGALDAIERAADAALTDVEWLEWCPVLSALRTEPRFVGVLERVRERTFGLWST
jgi:serine/threonine-protein kinase